MNRIFLSLTFSFLLIQCTDSQKTVDTSSKKKLIVKTKKTESIPVPVYDSFDDMAHIFNQKNDTTYIINFWATWCKPCVEELPYFEDIHEKYADQPVKVILVSLDFSKQLESKLYPFLKERNIQSDVMVLIDNDSNYWISAVEESWEGAIPITIIYNKDKRQFIGEQFANHDELESILKTFL